MDSKTKDLLKRTAVLQPDAPNLRYCGDCGVEIPAVGGFKYCGECRREAYKQDRQPSDAKQVNRALDHCEVEIISDPSKDCPLSPGARITSLSRREMLALGTFTPGTILRDKDGYWRVVGELDSQQNLIFIGAGKKNGQHQSPTANVLIAVG